TRKNAEQRSLVTFVDRELAWSERDVRHHHGKPLALALREIREHRDLADLLRSHHERVTALTLSASRAGDAVLCVPRVRRQRKLGRAGAACASRLDHVVGSPRLFTLTQVAVENNHSPA